MNIMSTHQCSWPLRIQDHPDKGSISKAPFSGYPRTYSSSRGLDFLNVGYLAHKCHHGTRKCRPIFCSSVSDSMDPYDSDDKDKNKSQKDEIGEFMGRNLLALNVMWKYMEQRSFPLTEEEYILRLDEVANTLKCWGAVSHIRNSLAKSKERPRIGKAVSIFIDMDESGARANEWIYK